MNSVACIIYTVADLDAATTLHAALLGVDPHTTTPFYVGFNVNGLEIALVPHGDGPAAAPLAYTLVPDLDDALAGLQAAGATLVSAPREVGGGARTATVSDANGTVLGLIHHA